MFLIILSITTLFTECNGTASSIAQTNWTNAYWQCRTEGKILSNMGAHALFNESYFWTGHYIRFSEWIKIIGCFEESSVNSFTKKSYRMHFPSAGRCQEVCLTSNYSVFGVQGNRCVCLEQIPGQGSRGANDCSLSCPGNYSAETNIKFEHDCGGHQTYNLFKSGSKMENSASTTNGCLLIQCGVDTKFIEQNCDTFSAQICNKTGQDKIVHVQSPNPRRCLKCNNKNCVFAECFENNYFVCMEKGPPIISQENIDERFTETSSSSYNTDYETTQTVTFQIKRSSDSSSSLIAVPVCLSLLLLLVCALALVFIIRKKKSKDLDQREQPPLNDSADYCNAENRTDNDYCELQQPTCNPTNQSADYSQLQFESTSTYYVDFDLAVHNAVIERPSNEIYYNMSSAESACINFGLQVDKNE
ncbi:uncharacterized protein LOC128158361 isoform X2 [Crassostrea angulata]|uniref:uncharacterized protein LOC128158361 isoform X2 n=1 Tax=Magallana angulata TaxID=2784310 RepID=UPI0022B0C83D|nr:uncharacterized protein LOC128158361 isoform X2 [Crassostrea angulata]